MDNLNDLANSIDAERVLRARQTPLAQKWLDGPRLFDRALKWMRAGVRAERPGITEHELEQEVSRRLAISRGQVSNP